VLATGIGDLQGDDDGRVETCADEADDAGDLGL
jgi:hypothetical protein